METSAKYSMNCEQAEALVLDLDHDGCVNPKERAAVLAHMSHCSRCAALQESWDAAKEELRSLCEETLDARAPERVRMRLMLEFRTRHRKTAAKRFSFLAAWVLAGAAAVVGGVTWWNARNPQNEQQDPSPANLASNQTPTGTQDASSHDLIAGLAGDDSSDFTPLPGVVPNDAEDGAILRVRMQRSSLGALGLPVNEQRASDWIQVDLLVGNDGFPQAVRLAQEEN